jgi:hypothetical protein
VENSSSATSVPKKRIRLPELPHEQLMPPDLKISPVAIRKVGLGSGLVIKRVDTIEACSTHRLHFKCIA